MNEAKSPPETVPSRLAELGEPCAVALAASLIAAVPTALRTASAGGGALDGLLVGAAVWLCFACPVALLRQRAARGWRGVVGADPPTDLGVALGLWAGLAVTALVVLGGVLKATTHHRGLGGTTYGIVGLAVVLGAAVLAVRLVSWSRSLIKRGLPRGAVRAGLVVAALGPPLVVTTSALSSSDGGHAHASLVSAAIVDVLLAVAALGLLMTRGLPGALRRTSRVAALPLALVILVAGFARAELSEGVSQAVRARGGVPAVVLSVLESWSDRDGDGEGAHFGGGDCDEGDPARRPGVEDPLGDGVDGDCDGTDGPRSVVEDSAAAVAAFTASAEPDSPSPSGAARTRLATDVKTRPSDTALGAADGAAGADAATAPPLSAAPAQPDVVVVTLDAVGANHSSTYGYAKKTTPALSALADRGVLFAHAFSIGSTTQRALVPIVTGRPVSASRRSSDEWPTLLDDNETLAERLKRAGYATAAVTSFTWLRQDRGFHQGFDLFDESAFRQEHPERGVTGTAAVAAVRRVYRELATGKAPLFLWVHLFDAHSKYVEHPGIDFGGDDRGRYDGEIAFVDQRLAELVALLSESTRTERTVLLVHGSHGVAFGEHGKQGHGREVYDEMIRVPLLVVAPWAKSRRYDERAVSTLDIAPTVLDYAGASRKDIDGVSLRPAVDGGDFEREPVRAYAWQRRCIIDWPLKLMARVRKDRPDRLLLFDLAADPEERRDISGEQPEALRRLDTLLSASEES